MPGRVLRLLNGLFKQVFPSRVCLTLTPVVVSHYACICTHRVLTLLCFTWNHAPCKDAQLALWSLHALM